MKQLPVAGVVVGILALFLSSAALFSSSGGGDEMGRGIEALKGSISALEGRINSLATDVKAVVAKSGDSSKALADLSARIAKAESGVARLGRSLADIPDAPAAGGGAVDPEKLREAVKAEIKTAFDRFRQQGMGGRGGDRRDPAQALREDVGLDDEKIALVTQAEQKMREEIGRYFRENRGGDRDRDAIRKMIQEAREKVHVELAKSLTPEEMKKYDQWRDQQRRGGGRGGRGGQQRPQPREQERPDDNAAF